MKFIRWAVFYVLYFIACMFVVVIALESLPDGAQMLFAFCTPALAIWLQERARSASRSTGLANETVDDDIERPVKPNLVSEAIAPPTSRTEELRSKLFGSDVQSPPTRHEAHSSAPPPSISKIASTPPSRAAKSHQGWLPRGQSVSVAGRDIGGMIYVGNAPMVNSRGFAERCRAYIDPTISVASAGSDKRGDGMSYWPGYSSIPPVCRATYLDWLVGGRIDSSVNPGYMFLYFYGLERRFFVDDPGAEEKGQIVEEVERLKSLFPGNHSVQRYLGEFLDLARISAAGSLTTDDESLRQQILDNRGWDLPLTLKIAMGGVIANGDPISADWLYVWFMCHYEKRIRTPAQRCEGEFRKLFQLKFDARFPAGMVVTKPRKKLEYSYRAASGEFGGNVSLSANDKPILDISGLRKPIEIAQEIADEAMEALDKFSRYLGRSPEGRGSLEAHALLPADLRPLFPSNEMEALKVWIATAIASGGLVPVAAVLAKLEGTTTDNVSKRQLTGAADALARLGFGMAPDPRHSLRGPKIGEPVVLFDLGCEVERLEDVSGAYHALLLEIALGTFIAQADNQIVEAERQDLKARVVDAGGITEIERRCLAANLDWNLAVPPDMALLRGKLKLVDAEHHAALRAALVAIAHADSVIQSEEVATIEKVYRALGLDPALVYSDLHAGKVEHGPVPVKAAEAATPGETIPQDQLAKSARLDPARIAAIRSDTQRVSAVLGEIFTMEGDAEEQAQATAPHWSGIDQKHRLFVEQLIARAHWAEDDFAHLASQHGLMSSGALETINEWSFEKFDEALLDEYDGYDVAPDIAEKLKADFVREYQ